ncbi:hypothetical protein HZI73_05790 [Vallitalea pronyensis]|uniref:Uncharacterized protein n=1 Tax=Vallitalea pronyensis TaxID=1348613 RepID=A0A8J8SG18_9FIRM|nr:Rid family hydrolase [Vallitalea pronyensis]QUI21838.1 hypothetical protein HZI73_05790 [Vallitalea pronyensis]
MSNKSKITVKTLEEKNHSRFYFTVDLMDVVDDHAIEKIYKNLCQVINKNGLKIVYEKCFGNIEFKEKWMNLRNKTLAVYEIDMAPLLYVEGASVHNAPMSGIQIYAISDHAKMTLHYIHNGEGHLIGTEMASDDMRILHLLENTGFEGDKESEYKNILESFETTILKHHFACTDIVRTWIYLYDINSYYEIFNKARRDFFTKVGINYSADSNNLPASTCIEGFGQNQESCMHVYCIDKRHSHVSINRVYNTYQNEASGDDYIFKSTFSRGMVITYDDLVELQISGTASINQHGDTIYRNNPYKQITYTIENIENILESVKMNFSDLCHVTCFFKDQRYYAMYKSIIEEKNIDNLPCTCVVGHVCREDLLFEFDGIAVKKVRCKDK